MSNKELEKITLAQVVINKAGQRHMLKQHIYKNIME